MSLIVSNDLHLMMLEIAVENLYVPWTSEFDRVILKRTTVMFRMLDNDWIPLSPNRRDCRPYQGSSDENEKFHGGKSVVFSVSEDFFEKEASGVDVQLHVRKEVCKYFEMKSHRQDIGFASVPVDDLLNGVSGQIRERNELAKYLSDFYKRQIISRSTAGTYTLRDEDLQDTAATITLYIRISCLGRAVVTELGSVLPTTRGLYRVRRESDEKDPYLVRKLTTREVDEGACWSDLPAIPGDLVCRCDELVTEEVTDLSGDRVRRIKKIDAVNGLRKRPIKAVPARAARAAVIETTNGKVRDDEIARMTTAANNAAKDALAITPDTAAMVSDAAADVAARPAADVVTGAVADVAAVAVADVAAVAAADVAAVAVADVAAVAAADVVTGAVADVAAVAAADVVADAVADVTIDTVSADTAAIERGKDDALDWTINEPPAKKMRLSPMDVKAAARAKEYAIKDNAAFKKTFATSKPRRYTATIGIVEREKRIYHPPPFPSLCQQTYPLYCRLQPCPTCFTGCFSIVPCYCRCNPRCIYT